MSNRKTSLGMAVNIGMLDALGVQMYENIGQSLVEFIANAYDADAHNVHITIPFEDISKARADIMSAAKKRGEDLRQGVSEVLPPSILIKIQDDGHGMTVEEIESNFLPLSRNRRSKSDRSESGKRAVMGRKGLGKLAGFGAAQRVSICSKRKSTDYRTTIEMNYDEISKSGILEKVQIPASYEELVAHNEHGTTIKLMDLRCDSMKRTKSGLLSILQRNFALLGDDFKVFLNGDRVEEPAADFEFEWPPLDQRTKDGLAPFQVEIEDSGSFDIDAVVKFRARGASDKDVLRGHLPAKERGARVYCKGRLAAGPTLFDLPTGMHNFHAQSYLICIVKADFLDELQNDLIGTNRRGLKSDNDIVEAFIEKVTSIMKLAIAAHAKFREGVVQVEMTTDPAAIAVENHISLLPAKQKSAARNLLKQMALEMEGGFQSEAFREIAPILVQAVNSSEVLIELIHSGTNPKDLTTIVRQLAELAQIEKNDALKAYRARRSGIDALRKLHERSHDQSPAYEAALHSLFKDNPWLVRPEFGRFLTSDAPMGDLAKKIDVQLQIDTRAARKAKNRPDLVFAATDSNSIGRIIIVELKSPSIDLEMEHLQQLKRYMSDVRDFMLIDHPDEAPIIEGFLIGRRGAPNSKATGVVDLKREIAEAGPNTKWRVQGLGELLEAAKKFHVEIIDALERSEDQDEDIVLIEQEPSS